MNVHLVNPEAEMGILGSIFVSGNAAWERIGDDLRPEHFGTTGLSEVFGACLDLVAERSRQRFASLVVSPGPAVVTDRAEEDETDLYLFLGEGSTACQRQRGGRGACSGDEVAARNGHDVSC